jgi:hypothetical protein
MVICTDVSGQSIGYIFQGHEVQEEFFLDFLILKMELIVPKRRYGITIQHYMKS